MGLFSSGKKEMQAALAAQREAQAALEAVGVPSIEAQKIILEAPELVGEFVPELAGFDEFMQRSEMAEIETAPELEAAQMQALNTLQERVDEGGLTATEEAELNDIMRSAKGQQQAQDARIMQNMAERGVLGSGMELAMRRASAQDSTQAAAQQAEQLAAMKERSKLDAINQLASLGGQMRSQEFGEKSSKAQAKDEMKRFNIGQRSTDRNLMNQARAMNLAERQRIAESATQARNQQQMYNKQLIQQDFQNRLSKASGSAQQSNVGSQLLANQAAAKQAGTGQLISGLGTMAMAKVSVGCFLPNTPIEMADNSIKEIEKIKVGDELMGGGIVRGITQSVVEPDDVFNYFGVIVTGDHLVKEDGDLIKIRDAQNSIPFRSNADICYNLSTDNGVIISNGIEFADREVMLEEEKKADVQDILAQLGVE